MDEAYLRLKSLKYVPDYRRIIRSKEEFKDSQFKADSTSIFSSSNSSFSPEVTSKGKLKMEWRRIKNIYKNEEITIVKDVSPNDVKQGQIGDGYFMSSLTSIALQQPSEIEKLFITKEFNESGIYAMNLLVNGGYQVVVVDDYVPYDVISKDLIFAGKKTKNIWPILLEKAWAKINGCYEDITSGTLSEALQFLVPYPTDHESYDPAKQTEEEVWGKITEALEKKYILTCSSRDDKKEITEKEFEKLGLVSNHAYSISGQFNIKYQDKRIKLLKIGNPWDRQEWKGEWSDSDTKWNSLLKAQVNFDTKRSGEFFVSFSDFLKYLSAYAIGHVNQFYDNESIELSHK